MKIVTSLMSLSVITAPTVAETWVVDPSGMTGVQTIQEAIDLASNGDDIQVMPGSYTGDGDSVIDTAGKAITIEAEFGATIFGEGQRTCVSCTSGETSDTVFIGFVFTAGEGGSGDNARGGAIHLRNSSPTFRQCSISHSESDYGGGVQAINSSATLEDCSIQSNSGLSGAGLYLENFDGLLIDCEISSNVATDHGGGISFVGSSAGTLSCCSITHNNGSNPDAQGGGIFVSSASPTLQDCVVSNNSASLNEGGDYQGKGGGLYIEANSDANIHNCQINHNQAAQGAGIYADGSTPLLSVCSIHDNLSDIGGGLFMHNTGEMIVDGCTIWNNTSNDGPGGGVYCSSSAPTMTQCTLLGNISPIDGGGGLYLQGSTASIDNCRITENQSCCGGGIQSAGQDDSMITACLIDANHAFINGGGAQCVGQITTTFEQCDFQNNTSDELFAALDGGESLSGPVLSENQFCANGIASVGGNLAESNTNARADLDGENGVNTQDLLMLISSWSNVNDHASIDVDLDGQLSVQDLLTVLENWGNCIADIREFEYLSGMMNDLNDINQPALDLDVDPEAWSAQVDFPEYTATISVDQQGGTMTALYGTSQTTYPVLRTTVRFSKPTTLQVDGFAEIASLSGTRFSVKQTSNCEGVPVEGETINFGRALDGPEEYSGTIDDLPPGTYVIQLKALLFNNGSIGNGIGVTWTYE